MRVLEREISKKWVERHLASHPRDYAFRIHDCPWEAKKFDYFLFGPKVAWALEFKVDRRKVFRYTIDELPAHQKRALKEFQNGRDRRSKVIVYHMAGNTWHEMEVE